MLMPFKEIIDAVYRTQFDPCLSYNCSKVIRADDVRKTGFVICEKICKQIQLASLVVSEISFDNSNVFYELGLAYALNKNLALFVQEDLLDQRRKILKKLGAEKDYSRNTYQPFGDIKADKVQLWHTGASSDKKADLHENLITVILADRDAVEENIGGRTVNYSIDKIAKGSIQRAIFDFNKRNQASDDYRTETINVLEDGYELDHKEDEKGGGVTFSEIEDKIRRSNCVIICTSQKEVSSYFWLGFAHGLEKNVIPITADRRNNSEPLPFDVRALWHIYFEPQDPGDLGKQIEDILRIIEQKESETKHRKRFWKELLSNGSASIFVGSVELTPKYKRHLVGEWDYRTVSELVGFLTSTKETMETVIQTPVFQASSRFNKMDIGEREKLRLYEIKRLEKLLYERDSIILGTADVNDMTEMVLSSNSGISQFVPEEGTKPSFHGIVAYKDADQAPFSTCGSYFRHENTNDNKRGFVKISHGKPVTSDEYRWACDYQTFEQDSSDDSKPILRFMHTLLSLN